MFLPAPAVKALDSWLRTDVTARYLDRIQAIKRREAGYCFRATHQLRRAGHPRSRDWSLHYFARPQPRPASLLPQLTGRVRLLVGRFD